MLFQIALLMASSVAPQPVPPGAKIEPSGFLSIAKVAPTPAKAVKRPVQPGGEAGWYARERNISEQEAQRRIAEQQALLPVFERLQARLRAKEPDNYTDARMIHDPDWAYVLYFKHNPAETLAKYSVNRRFKAAQAPYSTAELQAMMKPWIERFTAAGILRGVGTDATYGTAEMMLAVSRSEFAELMKRHGWGQVPEPIKLSLAGELVAPATDPRVERYFRAFANEPYATVMQLEALGTGRIFMKDGCLFVAGFKEAGRSLAYFHRETGVGLDQDGYLALIDRRTGKATGRIGERFAWGAPNAIPKDDPGVARLKARCGNLPVESVGNPESEAVFNARYSR